MTVQTSAILVGKDGLGPWELPEMRACLTQMVRRKLPVIPVLLPGCPQAPELPLFLGEVTWVDLRDGLTADGLDRLEWGINGRKPNREKNKPHPPYGPKLHNLPFLPLGDLLKGRDNELRTLEANLQGSTDATAITQTQAISGLGGIGKTRLAVEYAWRSGNRYDAVLFVAADSPEALRSGLAKLAEVDLPGLFRSPSRAQEEEVAAVLVWLREHNRWLLILDNVDTPEAAAVVEDLLPRLTTGHVLITSRWREWPAEVQKQPLGALSPEEAVQFLLQRTDRERANSPTDLDQVKRLAEILDGLPLALGQAAAYIAHHQISFKRYLEDWGAQRPAVLFYYDKHVMRYPASVAVTWQTSFNQLSPTAAAILRLSAYLAPDPIPLSMFEEGAAFRSGSWWKRWGRKPSPQKVREGLAELAAYSLLTKSGETGTVHRMVQEVVRSLIPEECRREWIERALRMVSDFSPLDPGDVRTWPVWNIVRPHATVVVRLADQVQITYPTPRLMSQIGTYLTGKGLYAEAETLIRRALAIEEEVRPSSAEVATYLNNLGSLLQTTNQLAEAEPLLRRSLKIAEDFFGRDHPWVSLSNLAQLLKDTNRLAEAEPLMRRALKINEGSFGRDHPNVARDLDNLAQLLKDTNRLAEAEPLMRRALKIDEGSFGQDHPNVASDLNNLALLLQITNRLAEAEPLMRRSLKIDEDFFGQDHPNVARNLNNLSQLLQFTNRLAEVESLLRRALKINEDSFGQDHPSVARDLNNLAQLLQATNRLAEAEPLMRRVVEILETSLGPNHRHVATALDNLALLLQATNRLAEAEPLMRRALKIDEDSFGQDHPSVAIRLSNLAGLLEATNRLAEAEPLMRRALNTFEDSFGQDHPNVARALNYLAMLLQATNRLAEAELLMRRALKIDEDSFEHDHPSIAFCCLNLAQLLKVTNRLAEAEPLIRRGTAILEASLGPNHPQVATALNNLAQLFQATNRLAEAEALARRALKINEGSFAPEHPTVATTLNNLAMLLKDTNRFAEAESLMRQAVQILERSLGPDHPNSQLVSGNLEELLGIMKPEDPAV